MRRGVAGEEEGGDGFYGCVLQQDGNGKSRGDAGGHGGFHVHFAEGEGEEHEGGKDGPGGEGEVQAEDGGEVRGCFAVVGEESHGGVEDAGEEEGDRRGAQHFFDIFKNICPRQGGGEEGAGRDGGAAVAEVDAGENGAADEEGRDAQGGAHGAADDAHGGGGAEGGTGEEGNETVQEKCHEKENAGVNELGGEADDYRQGPGVSPKGGEHADEEKGDEDIFHSLHAGEGELYRFQEGVAFA